MNDKEAQDAFKLAFKSNLFSENDPFMYMGQDEDNIYFKNQDTRLYIKLVK